MSGYLQRLLDTAAPVGHDTVSLTPAGRSPSPVFEQDQLLGLQEQAEDRSPGAEPPPAAGHRPAPVWASPAQPHPEAPPVLTATADAGPTAAMRERRSPAAPPEMVADMPSAPELPRTAPPAARLPERPPPPADLPPEPRGPPAVCAAPPPTVVEPTDRPPALPTARQRLPRAAIIEAAGVRARHAPAPHPGDPEDSADPVGTLFPSDTIERPAPAEERPRIELSPRPRPEPVPEASPYSEPPPTAPAVPQPTITIGQVTVELVGEPRSAATAPHPLTAASASLIGPLGQSRAARRLLALRRL